MRARAVLAVAGLAASTAAMAAEADEPVFRVGPIDGLTTAWHPAPESGRLPRGGVLRFERLVEPGVEVTWYGAQEVERDDRASVAECPIDELGRLEVRVEVHRDDAPEVHRTRLEIVDFELDAIDLQRVRVWVPPTGLDQNASNQDTMRFFYNAGSIAAMTVVDGVRVTSVRRTFDLEVQALPESVTPWLEWRVDGVPIGLGAQARHSGFETEGLRTISVGPPDEPLEIEIQAYRAVVTSHVSFQDVVADGEPVTFEVETVPSGFEPYVQWLSSTRWGTASPVLGRGPTFTAVFDGTFGEDGSQWLGVRADNADFNQDQKCSCSAQLGDATIVAGRSAAVDCVVRNTATDSCNFSWNVTRTAGTPTVDPSPPSGSFTLAGGAQENTPLNLSVPASSSGRDAATMTLEVTGDATCSDTGEVCVIPDGETTASNGWGTGNLETVHRWRQTLTPNAASFSGRTVTERDAGGGGPDTCWFSGSAFPPQITITGGTWGVGTGNAWGDDFVGWLTPGVTYYRGQGRAPCGTVFPQDMEIDCPGPDPDYTFNTLTLDIGTTTVGSGRDGQSATRTWP